MGYLTKYESKIALSSAHEIDKPIYLNIGQILFAPAKLKFGRFFSALYIARNERTHAVKIMQKCTFRDAFMNNIKRKALDSPLSHLRSLHVYERKKEKRERERKKPRCTSVTIMARSII